jgi:hypothetical protein
VLLEKEIMRAEIIDFFVETEKEIVFLMFHRL